MGYHIFTDATADMSAAMLSGLPEVTVLPMDITIGTEPYTYGPEGNITIEAFYQAQRGGKFAGTSQINAMTYQRYFEPVLKRREDILYLCFSSGLSGTFQAAQLCARQLRERYPERKIICMDTLCASVGEGFLVCEALRRQRDGAGIAELAEWVVDHRLHVCHWFTVDIFDHLKHGGRVSAAAAVVGTALNIKPMLHVSVHGTLEVASKLRGSKHAMHAQMQRFKQGWMPELGRLVVIGHGDCPEKAKALQMLVAQQAPDADIHTAPIGPIIGSHTGPGMLALIYWGDNR